MKRALSWILTFVLLLGMMPIQAFSSTESAQNPWSGRSAVFVGDSITAGSGTTKIYYEYLEESLGFDSVTPMGVAGSCISAASDYGQSNQPLINRYQSIPSADLIVVFMGTNDYGHETPLGSVADTQDGTFYGALNVIVPALVAEHSSSKIVFITPLHRYGFGTSKILGTQFTSDDVANGVGATLGNYVEALKTVCANNGVSVIDLYAECTLDPADAETRTNYMPDGLHPNAAGHEVIAGIMESHILAFEPMEQEPVELTEMIYGNKFAAGNNQTCRASSRVNYYLKAGTVITLKDSAAMQWACTKTSDETSSSNLGYFPDGGWSDKETAVVEADGWVGFVFKYRDETQVFDLTKPLSDYITIEEPHTHAYSPTVTLPTSTEQGYTTYTCTCGDSYVGDYTCPLGHYSATAQTLADGSELILTKMNTVMNGKHMRLHCTVDDLGNGVIRLGHGKTEYASQYIEITADVLRICTYYSDLTTKEYSHGLNIGGDIEVSIDTNSNGKGTITIVTASGTYTTTCGWDSGRNGAIFCGVEGTSLSNVDCRWYCEYYASDVWFYGDSYFNLTAASRWTSYLITDGYTDVLLEGYPGMGTYAALNSFKEAVRFGAPKYVVWCMGMNNADTDSTTPNSGWLTPTQEFLALCEEYGITPILSTIPSTPTRSNAAKNTWVKSSGHRYIDFEYAVVADYTTNSWYDGFLYTDNVHPVTAGAEQLYLQTMLDFPELTTAQPDTCTHILRCVSEKNGTCQKDGCKSFWLCTLCGGTFALEDKTIAIDIEDLQISGHDYVAAVTYPEDTVKGYTTYTCACGDSYRAAWLDESAYEGKTIACVGDSITAAYGVTKDETDYVTLLAKELGMNYIRLGVSGTTLCTDGSRTCNIGKLTESNLSGADVVTIAMGINDFCAAGTGYYELGDISSTDSSTIYGAVRMWCERIAELRKTESLSDTQFYFVTPVITSWNNSVTSAKNWDQSKTNIHGYTLRDLCNAIIEVATLYNVGVVDLNLLSGLYYVDAQDNNIAVFGGDGVHPGDDGHAMMAAALANVLLQNDLRADHSHTYGSWITTTWPTCAAGVQQRVCSVCSATERRTAEPTHTYESVVTAPTCTEKGYTTYTCACGDSYVGDYTPAVGHNYHSITCTVCGESLAGKTVSILSHSISTYAGVSNDTGANSTIGSNDIYYTEGRHGVYLKDTWWQQTIDALGMRLLVNNSWSGSCVFMPRKGEESVGYGDRAINLHNDHTGEEPDIIFVYLGCNDFAYYKDTFGTAADVSYAELIQDNGDGTFTYAVPTTACEAYAITLHKVEHRYPNAEIYCLTSTARREVDYTGDTYPDAGQPTAYVAHLHQIAEHFGFPVVDLENAIPKDVEIFDKYMGDKRAHPNALGMDQITNEVLSVMLGREVEICHVTSNGAVAEQAVLFGGNYNAEVTLQGDYSVVVTMAGKDITAEAYKDGKVTIGEVTGDIVITANRQPLDFVWELVDDELASTGETENALSVLAGTVSDGVINNGRYEIATPVVLRHDLPWELKWQCAGNWRGIMLSSDPSSQTSGMLYLCRTKGGQLCFGTWTGSQYSNYGVDISDLDSQTHTFQLINRVASDGSNMVYLIVDGVELGAMNNYFIGSNSQNTTSDWVSGKDFLFPYMGVEGHPLNNCAMEYIRVWEGGHTHSYENGICTGCGSAHSNLANYESKVVSILGDSISTFAGYIPTADGFNLEHLARYPQDNLLTDVNETWWMQVIAALNGKLGINDSWRGATVSGAVPVTTGTTGENAAMGNLQRLRNLGANGTPDVILFYGGTNDLAHVSKVGAFDPDNAPSEVDLETAKWDNLADGYVHTLLRLKHFYPDAQIIAMLPTYTGGYYSNEKLAEGNAVLAAICEHYGVTYVDLRECGISTADLPDNIHPNAAGMDYITAAVVEALLNQGTVAAGENVVHSVTHQLSNAESSMGYYKGVTHGKAFETHISGEELKVTVTMGGTDITDAVYSNGVISIESVTDDIVISAEGKEKLIYEDHLQQLPEAVCAKTNLWAKLEHDEQYYTVDGWGIHSSGTVYSVTFPVSADDQVYATSFGASGTNGGSMNGIRVTWFDATGVLKSVGAAAVYTEFSEKGYLSVPEGAVAVSIPMWTVSDGNEIYLLGRDHYYEEGICLGCGAADPDAVLAKLYMYSISLKGNIAINYYMDLSPEVVADETAFMRFTFADSSTLELPVSEAIPQTRNGKQYYVFSCGVNAKEMTDAIKAQFFYEGGSSKEYGYNVESYAQYFLENSTDEGLKALVAAMLNYGAASQLHFGYNTDNLANACLGSTPDYSGVSIDGFPIAAGQGTELAKFYSASLILKSTTTLRFFFTGSFTATYNGNPLEVTERNGLYYADVVGISAKDLDEDVTITIDDGENSADITFNPMAYCATVRNDETGAFDQEMKDLVSALYLYNQAANQYLEDN